MPKPLALWTAPRSISTAFERMMWQRGDFTVYHEPFLESYYHSTEKRSVRFADPPKKAYDYDSILSDILETSSRTPVFIKELTAHVAPKIPFNIISHFNSALLIRNPSEQLPSLYRGWPDFTLDETSYPALDILFSWIVDCMGYIPPIIDTDDLLNNPEGIVVAYCAAIGIEYRKEALQWPAGLLPELRRFEGGRWHTTLATTTSFARQPAQKDINIDQIPKLREAYRICAPIYERLRAHRLQPN